MDTYNILNGTSTGTSDCITPLESPTLQVSQVSTTIAKLSISDNVFAEKLPTKQNPPSFVYNNIYGKSQLIVTVYDEIDGTIYKILYTKGDRDTIFFSDIESRIVNDAIRQHRPYKEHDINGIHLVVDSTKQNTVHILNHTNRYKNGHLCIPCTICISV